MKAAISARTVHIDPRKEGALTATDALEALAALGQPTRLEIFRILMRCEPEGLAAGLLADELGCPQNTLSTHLAVLTRADLIYGTRVGRSIIYRAHVEGIRSLIAFLVTDCCNDHPELCDLQSVINGSVCGGKALENRQQRGKKRR